MDMNELQQLSIEELKQRLAEVSRELLGHRLQHAGGSLVKTHVLRLRKCDIARLKTMLRMKAASRKNEATEASAKTDSQTA